MCAFSGLRVSGSCWLSVLAGRSVRAAAEAGPRFCLGVRRNRVLLLHVASKSPQWPIILSTRLFIVTEAKPGCKAALVGRSGGFAGRLKRSRRRGRSGQTSRSPKENR